jgi:hypothetical protein
MDRPNIRDALRPAGQQPFPVARASNLLLFFPVSKCIASYLTLTLSLPQHLTTNTNTAATYSLLLPTHSAGFSSSTIFSSVSASHHSPHTKERTPL